MDPPAATSSQAIYRFPSLEATGQKRMFFSSPFLQCTRKMRDRTGSIPACLRSDIQVEIASFRYSGSGKANLNHSVPAGISARVYPKRSVNTRLRRVYRPSAGTRAAGIGKHRAPPATAVRGGGADPRIEKTRESCTVRGKLRGRGQPCRNHHRTFPHGRGLHRERGGDPGQRPPCHRDGRGGERRFSPRRNLIFYRGVF